VKHVILIDCGKNAITSFLKTYNKPGKVYTPAYNCIAVPQAIISAGYSPNFVDSPPEDYIFNIEYFIQAKTQDVNIDSKRWLESNGKEGFHPKKSVYSFALFLNQIDRLE